MARVVESTLADIWDAARERSVSGRLRPHSEYQTDPVGWAVEKLGVDAYTLRWSLDAAYGSHAWDGTVDPLATAYEAIRDWKDVGIESGTGTGKSYGVAVLILWFLACWDGSQVYTFAPKEDQLRLYIWRAIGELWPKFSVHFPTATLTDLCIRMHGGIDESWAAHGYAVGIKAGEQVSTKASGMHAVHMLLVYEEMPGIPQQVIEAGKNTCTAPHNLRIGIGNPQHQLDTLHVFCGEPGVVAVRASALDHPNVVTGNPDVIPGAVSQVSISRRLTEYGASDPIYQSRVRGLSPEQASNALIRLEWLRAAAARYEARKANDDLPTTVTGKGVDVANSSHGDRAAICDFAENVAIRLDAFACPDANALGRQVVLEMNAAQLDPRRVGIDGIGVGAGTVNECRRLGKVVQALMASAQPMKMQEKAPDGQLREWTADVNIFANLRAQMYWQAREDLRLNVIDAPEDQELWTELTAPTFADHPKTIVEPKAEIAERLGRSPDKADAFVMANWVRERRLAQKPDPIIGKLPHRAHPIVVEDGKVVAPKKVPKTLEELAEWAANRANTGRLPTRERERLPRSPRRTR